MNPLLYILSGLAVGTLLGWLLGTRYKPDFNKQLEDELREQIRQLQETLATVRRELSASNQARAAAETARESADIALAERRELQERAERAAAELRDKHGEAQNALEKMKYTLEVRQTSSTTLMKDYAELKTALEKLQSESNEIKRENSGLNEKRKFLEERLADERKQLQTLQETFKKEFEAISNKLLLHSAKQFTDQSSERLDNLLKPLKTNIDDFKAKLDLAHNDATVQSALLKEQVKNIGTEAANLSKALKGEAKTLGDWGENMLDLILEKSGLKKDIHYRSQESAVDDGKQRYLDVVVDLPDDKHLVIDSKVSLNHYKDHANCEDEALRQGFLEAHIGCIKAHIRDLSAKRYQDIYGINAPDFVMMYIPIEAAFFVAVESDQNLFADALDKNVVLITNSTLLATLRTVAHVWRLADQKKNHLDIADRGGKLYDKFCSFVEDMQKIGIALDGGKAAWDEAFKKLSTGSGNLVGQVEKLRKLGVKATKALSVQVLEDSDEEDAKALPEPATGAAEK